MKKTIFLTWTIVASSIAITLFTLGACQPTPTEVFVIEKDTERMVEKASSDENGTIANSIGIPSDHYTYDTTDISGKVKINVDAEVLVPDVDYLPIARVAARSFTEQDVENIYEALCNGATPISEDALMPKFFYQHTLDGLLELRQSGELDN